MNSYKDVENKLSVCPQKYYYGLAVIDRAFADGAITQKEWAHFHSFIMEWDNATSR